MALPADLTTITVTGSYTDGAGNPQGGSVTFTPSSELTDQTGKVVIGQVPIVVQVSSSTGAFSQAGLACTDNANLYPASWAWVVTVNVAGASQTFNTYLPSGLGSTVDISALAPYMTPAPPPPPPPPLTQTITPGTAAGGDLSGTYPSPQVWQTHLAKPLPIVQGGTGATTAAGALTTLGASPAGAMLPVATTGPSGYTLVNGTGTILSWTAPNDGVLHSAVVAAILNVSSAETGGLIQLITQDPAGGTAYNQVAAAGNAAGSHASPTPSVAVGPGRTVAVSQTSALTAGAATLWAVLWAA